MSSPNKTSRNPANHTKAKLRTKRNSIDNNNNDNEANDSELSQESNSEQGLPIQGNSAASVSRKTVIPKRESDAEDASLRRRVTQAQREDDVRRQLGLRTRQEEVAEVTVAEKTIVRLDAELEAIRGPLRQTSTIPSVQQREKIQKLEDELADARYTIQLARDRELIVRIDKELETGRLTESDLALLAAMREQYINLMLVSAELRQIELNRRLLRDRSDDSDEFEEVFDESSGQFVLRPKNLGENFTLEPGFVVPGSVPGSDQRGQFSLREPAKLQERVRRSLLPATELTVGTQPLSGDSSQNNQVSVNVIRPEDAAKAAQFFTSYQAGGAIPIAIEQFGDRGVDSEILSQRAMNSAMFVIDPAKLPQPSRAALEITQGSGEFKLQSVLAAAFVAVIVPGAGTTGMDDLGIPVVRVGTKKGEVTFTYDGGKKTATPSIEHPDYEAGLRAVLAKNPRKTLLVHVTRLGEPDPINK